MGAARSLFDRYVAVDWSAASRPTIGRNSIWIADLERSAPVRLSNPPTRLQAESVLADVVASSTERGQRTLIGVDAALGYPSGTAMWFGLHGERPWRAVWAHLGARLVDDDRNSNDRFDVAAELNRRRRPGPFWGHPPGRWYDGLTARKPDVFPLAEFRVAEVHLRARRLRPASVWQLLGAGSVGSQTLTLLPVLERLRRAVDPAAAVEVWPFTTGLGAPSVAPGTAVVAEIWPTVFPVSATAHEVRDAAQVLSVAAGLCAADDRAMLGAWFCPSVDADTRRIVEAEEGWILGPV